MKKNSKTMKRKYTEQEKLDMCRGCRQHFYNGNNQLGIDRCWNLKSAKVVQAFRIGWHSPCNIRNNYREVTTLSCHTSPGNYADYTFEQLPRNVQDEIHAEREPKKTSKKLLLLKSEGLDIAYDIEYMFVDDRFYLKERERLPERKVRTLPKRKREVARLRQIYSQWPDLRPSKSVLDTIDAKGVVENTHKEDVDEPDD